MSYIDVVEFGLVDRSGSKGTDLFAWSRFGEESNVGYIFVFRVYKAGMK